MAILVDIDGTISNYNWAEILPRFFGASVNPKNIWCYSIEDCLGVSSAQVDEMFQAVVKEPANMYPGARETLQELVVSGVKVAIHTRRAKYMTEWEIADWLNTNDIPFSKVESNPQLFAHSVHIDDSPAKLFNLNGATRHKVLFVQPWNTHCLDINGKLIRVRNWAEIKTFLEELSDANERL